MTVHILEFIFLTSVKGRVIKIWMNILSAISQNKTMDFTNSAFDTFSEQNDKFE
jgi:hypothetical protein